MGLFRVSSVREGSCLPRHSRHSRHSPPVPGFPGLPRVFPGSRATPGSRVPGPSHGLPYFYRSGLDCLGLDGRSAACPRNIPPPVILEIDYTTRKILVKSTGTFEGVAFLKIITPCGAAGSNLQKLPVTPFLKMGFQRGEDLFSGQPFLKIRRAR